MQDCNYIFQFVKPVSVITPPSPLDLGRPCFKVVAPTGNCAKDNICSGDSLNRASSNVWRSDSKRQFVRRNSSKPQDNDTSSQKGDEIGLTKLKIVC